MDVYTYQDYIDELGAVRKRAADIPLGKLPAANFSPVSETAPGILLFSPHPDDECITGGLAFRLRHQSGMKVVNVAVTQGSRRDRQAARWRELQAACDGLGFDLVGTIPDGLEKINRTSREQYPEHWQFAVGRIADLIHRHEPQCIFLPHQNDWNSTHIGTHFLVMDALAKLGGRLELFLVETEFWAPMQHPNVLVESSPADVARLVAATSCHAGEVTRNPYHLSLPVWMQDNVRRGAEVVGGQGGEAPQFPFGTLYAIRRWRQGTVVDFTPTRQIVTAESNPCTIFEG